MEEAGRMEERGTENTCMNVRAFSLHVKQKVNSPKVVSKETVLNEKSGAN